MEQGMEALKWDGDKLLECREVAGGQMIHWSIIYRENETNRVKMYEREIKYLNPDAVRARLGSGDDNERHSLQTRTERIFPSGYLSDIRMNYIDGREIKIQIQYDLQDDGTGRKIARVANVLTEDTINPDRKEQQTVSMDEARKIYFVDLGEFKSEIADLRPPSVELEEVDPESELILSDGEPDPKSNVGQRRMRF